MCIALELQVIPMDGRAASHTPCKLTEDTNSYYRGKVPGAEYYAWLCAYLDGYLTPHYPVPALITDVVMWDNDCCGNGVNLSIPGWDTKHWRIAPESIEIFVLKRNGWESVCEY